MKRAFAVILALSFASACAQNAPEPVRTPHDWAMHVINDYLSFEHSSRGYGLGSVVVYGAEINLGEDGLPRLSNISEHDAFLVLYAEELERSMETSRQVEAELAAIKDLPPPAIVAHGKTYHIHNLPQWDQAVVGDTSCTLHDIRILETDTSKRDTVLHEIMHVATNCDPDPQLHEDIYRLAPALLKIMRDNPDLVKYLTAGSPQERRRKE